ncbi:hypothetical protein [Paraburkholderia sediminicola]|uniref:hypothetical protein n=1 Tax=Paraburkholderia sediminicola TaxID=458836 RepID=UPI0038B6BD3B
MSVMAPTVSPPPLSRSSLGFDLPDIRAAQLPGMTSVNVRDLFPDIPEPLQGPGDSVVGVRKAAEIALEQIDMSCIGPSETVNLLCSEHGFAMNGGEAYAELIRTIKDVVEQRTGNRKIRLGFGCALNSIEALEVLPRFGLEEYFGGRTVHFGPYDKGVAIETEIGTLYGVGRAFKADKIIHVHYDDPREVHFHRLNGRALKAFAMSYARLETRSVFHNHFPSVSANLVPRMIYESPFIRDKWAFAAMLTSSPAGITGAMADNDLIRLDKRVNSRLLRLYGKMVRLFDVIEDCIVVMDGHRWIHYCHAGGLTSCNLFFGPTEHLDLDLRQPRRGTNRAVRAIVINYMWKYLGTISGIPTITTSPSVTAFFRSTDPRKVYHYANDLPEAMDKAREIAQTDKVMIFDGSYGAINCSPSMAEFLRQRAPEISREVDEVLLPKWLKQRGLPLDE